LPGRQEDGEAVDGLQRQRQAGDLLDFPRQAFVVRARRTRTIADCRLPIFD